MNKEQKKVHENIANKIIAELKLVGIQAYIWHVANTGSVYIRFDDVRMCSIRIGDHDEKEKLKYKYNIRSDIHPKHPLWKKDENIWRCYLSANRWKEVIKLLIDRNNQIKEWPEAKFQYNIPKHKQKL